MNPGKRYQILRVSPSWKVQKMITVGLERKVYDSKYKRFFKRRTRVRAHYDLEDTPVVGGWVRVRPCRPISSLKRHIVHG